MITQKNNTVKYCNHCNDELVVGNNWTNHNQIKRDYICSNCQSKRNSSWKEKHADMVKQSNEEYYKQHMNVIKERSNKYRQTVKGKLSQKKGIKKYQQTDKGKVSAKKFRESEKGKSIQRKANKKFRDVHQDYHNSYQKSYRGTKKGHEAIRKAKAKCKRNLGYIEMFGNPFAESVKVDWHHITDVYVVAIPRDLHKAYSGYNQQKHRELVMEIAKQIYLWKD